MVERDLNYQSSWAIESLFLFESSPWVEGFRNEIVDPGRRVVAEVGGCLFGTIAK
jgi:hypothetical protein